jgi:hypothetical protein
MAATMDFAMKNLIELNKTDFGAEFLRATGPVRVDLYAPAFLRGSD